MTVCSHSKELKAAHVSMSEAVELMFNHTLEGKGTNWEVFRTLLVAASAEGDEVAMMKREPS